jgi:hypothetical protein
MALTTFNPRSFDLSDTYTFTGTVSGTNVGGGSLVKISEQTASASDSISFTSGIDSTYRTYLFKYISMHPSTMMELIFNFKEVPMVALIITQLLHLHFLMPFT